MNKDENFKLLLTNIQVWKRVFIKKLEYSSICIIEKTYISALISSQICHKNAVLFIAVTQWSIL